MDAIDLCRTGVVGVGVTVMLLRAEWLCADRLLNGDTVGPGREPSYKSWNPSFVSRGAGAGECGGVGAAEGEAYSFDKRCELCRLEVFGRTVTVIIPLLPVVMVLVYPCTLIASTSTCRQSFPPDRGAVVTLIPS